MLVTRRARRPCPACGEQIAVKAVKCRHCGEVLDKKKPRKKSGSVDSELVRRFRREIHGLGGFWIFVGVLVTGVAMFLVGGNGQLQNAKEIGLVIGALGILYIGLGVCACLKQMWAVYVGLGLSYLSLIGNFINFNVKSINPCPFVVLFAVIFQAHRTIGWARQMNDAGIPLDSTP